MTATDRLDAPNQPVAVRGVLSRVGLPAAGCALVGLLGAEFVQRPLAAVAGARSQPLLPRRGVRPWRREPRRRPGRSVRAGRRDAPRNHPRTGVTLFPSRRPLICLVTDRSRFGLDGPGAADALAACVAAAAKAGVDIVQVRERDLEGGA